MKLLGRLSGAQWGAVALLSGAMVVSVGSLARGHQAMADPPVAVGSAPGLDVWKGVALLLRDPQAKIVDLRPAAQRLRFALPRSVVASAQVESILAQAAQGPVLLVTERPEEAVTLAQQARGKRGDAPVYALEGGVRAWYLALELPVPLFAAAAPPADYDSAVSIVRHALAGEAIEPSRWERAVRRLAESEYQPTLLEGKKKSGGAAKKKISGGCGG